MKEENYINHIVRDFLEGKLNSKQRKKFLKMLEKNKKSESLEHIYQSIFDQIESLSDKDLELLQSLLKKEHKTKNINTLIKPLLKYAAVLVMLLGGYFTYQWIITPNHYFFPESKYASKTTHILPDGSEIILYPKSFFELVEYNNHSRSILLHGKAEFTVVPSKTPFFVKSESAYFTKVLGTKFIVQNGMDEYRVSVERGRVSIGKGEDILGVLAMGDSIVIDDHIHLYSNKKNPLFFDSMKLSHVLDIVNKAYDSEVILAKGLDGSIKCTAVFEKHLSIVEIVEILCEMYGYTYSINAHKIIIQS